MFEAAVYAVGKATISIVLLTLLLWCIAWMLSVVRKKLILELSNTYQLYQLHRFMGELRKKGYRKTSQQAKKEDWRVLPKEEVAGE